MRGQGRRPIGASTITQQVAKNMLLDSQMSLLPQGEGGDPGDPDRAEPEQGPHSRALSERDLLGLALYGVAAAAQAYFNKPLDKLTVAEAAFLAALPKAPNNLNPFKFPDAARSRRDYVLDRMAEDHAITPAQAAVPKRAADRSVGFRRPPPIPAPTGSPRRSAASSLPGFGQETTTQGGLMVRTSLDPTLQIAAEKSLRDGLMAYDRKMGGWRGAVTHLTLAVGRFRDANGRRR